MSIKSLHVDYSHQGLGRSASSGHSLPRPYPLTVVYNAYVDADDPSQYATFFAMGPDAFSGTNYYTTATVIGAPASNMSVGVDGVDTVAAQVVTGKWMAHALVCYKNTNTVHDFYYGLPDLAKKVTKTVSGTSYFSATSGTTFLRFNDVEWAIAETLAGRMRGAKIWTCALPAWALAIEAESPYPVLEQFKPYLWGAWPMRTAQDRFDISGNGRHLYIPNTSGGTEPLTIADSPSIENAIDFDSFDPEILPIAPAASTPLVLRQIERGQTTMTTTATQSTVTLGTTLLDTSKAFLVFTLRTTGADTRDYSVGGKILSTTQIQFNRATGVLNTAVIEWQVVEFTSGIFVQHVEVIADTASKDTAITAIDLAKTFAMTTNRNTGTGWGTDDLAIVELTSTTNLQVRITAGAATNVQNVQVIQIDNASVQKFVTTYGTGTTKDITVTTIDPAKTFWYFSATAPAGINNDNLPYLAYVNSTTLRFTRVNAAGNDYPLVVYVVSLSAGLTVQNVLTTIASSASTVSPTISTVTVANTLLILNGIYHRFASANEANDAATTSAFGLASLGTTSFTATRASAPAIAATAHVQVLSFGGATQYTQSISATSGNSVSDVLRVGKTISSTSIGVSTLSRLNSFKRTLVATSASLATDVLTVAKSLSSVMVGASTLAKTKAVLKDISAASTNTVTIIKSALKSLSITQTPIVSLAKVFSALRTLSAASSNTVSFIRLIAKSLSSSSVTVATMTVTKIVLKALTTTFTGTASILKSVGKILGAAAVTVGTITRLKTFAITLSAAMTGSGSIVRSIYKTLSAAMVASPVVNPLKIIIRAMSTTFSGTASMARRAGKTLSATSIGVVTISFIKSFLRTLSASMAGNPSIIKLISKSLAAAISSVATMAPLKIIIRTMTATATTTTSFVKRAGKTLSASASSLATTTRLKTLSVILSASSASVVSIVRSISKSLSSSLSGVVSLSKTKVILKTLQATASIVLSGSRRIGKIISMASVGSVSIAIRKTLFRSMSVTASNAVSLFKQVGKAFSVASSNSVSLRKSVGIVRSVVASITPQMALLYGLKVVMNVSASVSASFIKRIEISRSAVISVIATQSKMLFKILSATYSFFASLAALFIADTDLYPLTEIHADDYFIEEARAVDHFVMEIHAGENFI